MTAAPPGPNLFSVLIAQSENLSRRRETFAGSLLAQAALLGLIIYFTGHVIGGPGLVKPLPIPVPSTNQIFLGANGGGGGTHEALPASTGTPPPSSLSVPIVPATVIVLSEMHKLMVQQSVEMAPDVKFPQTAQIGDPNSPFSHWLSNGKGGPNGGIGDHGCCGGDGNSDGPYVGNGPRGIFPAGKHGVGIPVAIYSPEPSFSDEARKKQVQGIVTLMLVVGKDGRPYDIHVRQSLGMGLDEQAIDAVKNWRFRPATLDGQPVDAQIAIEVNFRLY
jgi:periplasmic protein TonB